MPADPLAHTDALCLASSALGPAMLDMHDIASALNVSYRAIQAWRASGLLPAPDFALGRVVRWRRSTIENFIASRSAAGGGA